MARYKCAGCGAGTSLTAGTRRAWTAHVRHDPGERLTCACAVS